MPLFRYTCKECDHPFEAFIQSSTVPACPKCGSQSLQKRFTAFAVRNAAGGGGATESGGGCSTGTCSTGTCPFV
ncbi:zinc ribbon domain-containing protein [Myxococcota bacterium]|nr:zinc ribbon domain-containing protein [Myxococcota bacterium]MBU1432010.1 zinc ribbon domain-containing protein [Myxococcota bacterium]